MSRRTIRCLSPAFLAVAVLVLGATTALAQHTTGFNMTKTCPTVVQSGASFQCTVTLANNDIDHGVLNLVVTNQVPFPGGPTTNLDCRQPFDPTDCTAGTVVTTLGQAGSPTASCGACIPETAPINCTAGNISFVDEVRAAGTDAAPCPGTFCGLPVSSSTTNATPVAPLVCADNNSCTTDSCDPATGCVFTPLACGDNNACTTDSCDPALGCVNTPISCGDNNACTTDSCNPATGCVNTPISCGDNNACTTDSCNPATGCVNTAIDCNDNNACTTDTCDPGSGCGNAPITCNDNNSCTDDSCNPATGCVYTDNGTCVNEEICRTPGFWGTHGGTEKEGHSSNITLAVLGAYCGTLEVCGTAVTNTDECSVDSALEAICVSPKGNSCLQLGRQLTAAALNCAITKSTNSDTGACQFPDCGATPEGVGPACEGLSIGAIWAACNTSCGADPCSVTAAVDLDNDASTPDVTVNCIGALDCFNNGFTIDPATGECTDTSSGCHERALCGDFNPPGAAGSSGECNDSRKNCVTIFGATDQCSDACIP
jgi:Dictyostelium (slime mold) repeat